MTTNATAETIRIEWHRALDECRMPTIELVPVDDSTTVPEAVYIGCASIGTADLLAIPGVTVLAEGSHRWMPGEVRLIEYRGERWTILSDDRAAIVNPGTAWADCVRTGAILPAWDAS